MTAGGFFLALAFLGIAVAAILAWEIRSRPRDPRSAGLRSANKDKGARR